MADTIEKNTAREEYKSTNPEGVSLKEKVPRSWPRIFTVGKLQDSINV